MSVRLIEEVSPDIFAASFETQSVTWRSMLAANVASSMINNRFTKQIYKKKRICVLLDNRELIFYIAIRKIQYIVMQHLWISAI